MTFLNFYFLLCIGIFTTAPAIDSSQITKPKLPISVATGGGSIVITDVIMLITLNNSNDIINTVQVIDMTDQLVLEVNSCGSYQCEYDLSLLDSGSYTIIVNTEKNDSFSSLIEL